jgi:oligopeptidase B
MSIAIQRIALIAAALGATAALAEETVRKVDPPMAKKNTKVVTLHGETLKDDYYWLRSKENPEVKVYLDSENAHTDAVMKGTEELQKKLYDEMLARIKETDLSVPYRKGDYFYYYRTEKGKQYRIYCRKKGTLEAPEEVTLDLNEFAKDAKFVGLGTYQVSDDGNTLAYSIDLTGFREYTLAFKDLRTGALSTERIARVWGSAWAADNKTVFYTTEDHAKRPYRLWRHRVGTDPASDQLVIDEKDEMFRVFIWRSRSKAYVFAGSGSHTSSETRYLRADDPQGEFRLLLARAKDREHDVEHRGDVFYIRVNDTGRNFRVVSAPVADPSAANWKEIVPHRDDVMVDSIDAFANHLVLTEWAEGFPRLTVMNLATDKSHTVAMPEPVYSVSMAENPEFTTTTLRYTYDSFTTPDSVYDYDMETRKAVLLKRMDVLGGYDPSLYESQRLFAKAPDGTRIPISLVQRKGTRRDGSNPLLLDGYGSYGAAYSADFNSNRFSLLDRGVVYAIAHIRGGGEMGKKWHDAGRMMSKKNTFTDFIAVAEHLIAEKYTSKNRLAIEGGSAGGLLMGAVVNMRPDLFRAVVSKVPFVDVINTMLDETIPLTVPEFEEWGNPKNPEHYAYMKSYSPYDNLAAKDYPAMLIKTSFNDSQVMYWEPAKYVAKLRAVKTDKNPLVFKINMAGGHGGSSGRYDRLREIAFDYAFLLWQLGREPKTAS